MLADLSQFGETYLIKTGFVLPAFVYYGRVTGGSAEITDVLRGPGQSDVTAFVAAGDRFLQVWRPMTAPSLLGQWVLAQQQSRLSLPQLRRRR